MNIRASAAIVVTATIAAPTLQIGYNPTPGWTQQWRTVQFHLTRLRQYYRSEEAVGNVEMGETVATLMIALWHLSDWLRHDDGLPDEVRAELTSDLLRRGSEPLAICNAYANTAKHSKRQSGWMVARNVSFISGPDGSRMVIAYGHADDAMQTIDALDLAQRCEQAWRDWMTEHGIAIPGRLNLTGLRGGGGPL